MNRMDLHTHTTASDGTESPSIVLQKAQAAGLSLLSVTDHNSVGAYTEIRQNRHLFDGEILTGTELSTAFGGELIEILGYGIDVEAMDQKIKARYLSFREKQLKERILLLDAMEGYGVKLGEEFKELLRYQPEKIFDPDKLSCRRDVLAEMQRYSENARFFSSEEELKTIEFHPFMRGYLNRPGSPLYLDSSSLYPSLTDTVEMIHSCGGKALVAHIFAYTQGVWGNIEELLAVSGVDGLECSYPIFTEEQSQYLLNICKEKGLAVSGGSDYHGALRPNPLGQGAAGQILTRDYSPWLSEMNFI